MGTTDLFYNIELYENTSQEDRQVVKSRIELALKNLRGMGLVKHYRTHADMAPGKAPAKAPKAPMAPRHRYADSIILTKENYETLTNGAVLSTIYIPIRLSKTLSREMSLEWFQRSWVYMDLQHGTVAYVDLPEESTETRATIHPPVLLGSRVYCKEYWRPVITSPDGATDYVEYYWGGTQAQPHIEYNLKDGVKAKLDYAGADSNNSSDKWHSPSSMPEWAARYTVQVNNIQVTQRNRVWHWGITVERMRRWSE